MDFSIRSARCFSLALHIAENHRYGREALSCHPGFPRCRGESCPDSITGDTSGNAGLIPPFPLFRCCVLPEIPPLFHLTYEQAASYKGGPPDNNPGGLLTRAAILLILIFYSYTPKLYFFTPSVFQKGISPFDAINPLKKSVMVPSITYSSKKQLSPTYKYLFVLDFVSSITRL